MPAGPRAVADAHAPSPYVSKSFIGWHAPARSYLRLNPLRALDVAPLPLEPFSRFGRFSTWGSASAGPTRAGGSPDATRSAELPRVRIGAASFVAHVGAGARLLALVQLHVAKLHGSVY